jgi:hypothetical protein
MSPRRGSVAGLLLVTFAVANAASASEPEGGGTPGTTVTVAPSDGLQANQSVNVSGTGFTANTGNGVDIAQCPEDPAQPCKSLATASSNASGNFGPTPSTVARMLVPDGGGPAIDCLTTACFIRAADTGGKYASHHLTFSGPAAVATSPATDVTASEATLNATVNPRRSATSVWFEYSATADLAQSFSTTPAGAGSGDSAVPMSQRVTGLEPDRTYYFRAAADRGGVVARGDIASFRTSGVPGPGGEPGPGGGAGDRIAPIVEQLIMGLTFRAASSGGPIASAAAAPVGTTVRYSLSEPAIATFRVRRRTIGRRVGTSCRKLNRRNRRRPRCVRYVRAGSPFIHQGAEGSNSFRFTGRPGRKLARGRYRLVLVATDVAGNRSAPKRRSFKIVKR